MYCGRVNVLALEIYKYVRERVTDERKKDIHMNIECHTDQLTGVKKNAKMKTHKWNFQLGK